MCSLWCVLGVNVAWFAVLECCETSRGILMISMCPTFRSSVLVSELLIVVFSCSGIMGRFGIGIHEKTEMSNQDWWEGEGRNGRDVMICKVMQGRRYPSSKFTLVSERDLFLKSQEFMKSSLVCFITQV